MSESTSMKYDLSASSIVRKGYVFKDGAIDRKERLIKGKIATREPDLEGDLFIPRGCDVQTYLTHFHRRVCVNHDTVALPAGINRTLKIHDDYIYASTKIFPTHLGNEILTLIEHGGLNGYSISFGVLKARSATPEEVKHFGDTLTGKVYEESFMTEYSVVGSPANASCVIQLVEKGLIKRATAHTMGFVESPVRKLYPTTGPAKVEKATEVPSNKSNESKLVYRDDKGNTFFKMS
jgi:hypothetical protein